MSTRLVVYVAVPVRHSTDTFFFFFFFAGTPSSAPAEARFGFLPFAFGRWASAFFSALLSAPTDAFRSRFSAFSRRRRAAASAAAAANSVSGPRTSHAHPLSA